MSEAHVFDLVVVGAGAAGFFAANQLLDLRPDARILLLEKGSRPLDKVRISGGGRCNVTHACFDPKELVGYYPRGHKELLGPFHHFQPGDTIAWFGEQGVELKIEEDGRMFPTTDSSQTIMDALTEPFFKRGGNLNLSQGVRSFRKGKENWEITTEAGMVEGKNLLVCPGSSKPLWQVLESLGHKIVPPVPSLFTFNCKDSLIADLPGVVAPQAEIRVVDSKFEESGPLLITHWGMSGPAVLKLSARAARWFHEVGYAFEVQINWIGREIDATLDQLKKLRERSARTEMANGNFTELPKRLWISMLHKAGVAHREYFAEQGNATLRELAKVLCECRLQINGKSTNKDEFVTAGGVDLKQVDFKTMESKVLSNLHFAGEVLNLDALTGGFNFQAAWTTAFLAAQAIAAKLH